MHRVGRFKGIVLVNAREFCHARFGEEGFSRVVASLPEGDRAVVEEALPVGWYDLGVYDRLHEAIVAELGDHDLAIMVPLGHFCAEHDLTTIHRVFLRMASADFLFSKYGDFWRRYQDTGQWSMTRENERCVRATLSSWGSTSEATCVRLAAYMEKFLELCGAHGARATRTRCRSRGDAVCEYRLAWSASRLTS
jgi:hypothetical protein